MSATQPIIKSDVPAVREPIPTPPATGNIDAPTLVFKEDFAFVDTETTGIDPDADAIVEIAIVRFRGGRKEVFHTLVNPGFPIPPTASAVHGITDEDVKDAPRIEELEDRIIEMLDGAFVIAHNAGFDALFVDPAVGVEPAPKEWLCTYRLSRHVFPDAPAHGNQVLRYWLKTKPETEGLGAHRAIDDVYVSIENFRHMLAVCQARGMASLAEVQALANQVIVTTVMPFGKHVDEPFDKIPSGYFEWALGDMKDLDEDLKASMQMELERRASMPVTPATLMTFGKAHKDKPLSAVPTEYFEWMQREGKLTDPSLRLGVEQELARRKGVSSDARATSAPPAAAAAPIAAAPASKVVAAPAIAEEVPDWLNDVPPPTDEDYALMASDPLPAGDPEPFAARRPRMR